ASPVTSVATLLGGGRLEPLVVDLAVRDLLQGDGEGLRRKRARLDQGRDELPATFAELAVIGVDLAGPFRRQDHQRIPRIHAGLEVIDLGLDHVRCSPSGYAYMSGRLRPSGTQPHQGEGRFMSIIAATLAAASSTSS